MKANNFWLNVLRTIQRFALNVATKYDVTNAEIQYKFYHHLFQQIMLGIFEANITFAATKPQPLLPSGMLKDIRSIKQFIVAYFGPYLDINQMLLNRKPKLTATKIREIIIERITVLLKMSRDQFQDLMEQQQNQQNQQNDQKSNHNTNNTNISALPSQSNNINQEYVEQSEL